MAQSRWQQRESSSNSLDMLTQDVIACLGLTNLWECILNKGEGDELRTIFMSGKHFPLDSIIMYEQLSRTVKLQIFPVRYST